MIYVYGGITILISILLLICKSYKKTLFENVDKREHPLKFFYPLSARCLDFFRKIVPEKHGTKIETMLKRLYVKENIEKEKYIYDVRKIAYALVIVGFIGIMGTAVCFTNQKIQIINQLERKEPGEGSDSVPIQVDYDGKTENINLEIEERQYSKDEINEIFDRVSEEIKQEILGKNESLDKVNQPLNLISEYQNVKIYWEIEDLDYVAYNGDISVDNVDNQGKLVNLYANLALNEDKRTVLIPILLVPKETSEKEILIENIKKSIEETNNIYDSKVNLPEKINEKEIQFKKIKENKDLALLLLALVGLAALMGLYDKTLEKKITKRSEEMMIDFTEIVSKLCLLYEAGLSVLKAWERIVEDYEKKGITRFAYQEMRLVLEKIKSGESERVAYSEFGKRCGLHPYIKLANILEQNIALGSKGLKASLQTEVEEAFEERKRLARKKGEEASTKLLVPMILMLIVVIVIIAVPAFMSITF
ncbi:MAG: type II secretion system F family protein [Lachnospiraceae bacterium]|nr:type II secretion system F family protein [Lachnospiraceae bacterium]